MRLKRRFLCEEGEEEVFVCWRSCAVLCEGRAARLQLPARGKRAGKQTSVVTGENLLFLLCVEPTVKMSAGLWGKREDLFLFTSAIYGKEVISGASNSNQCGGESVGQFCFSSGNCDEENLSKNVLVFLYYLW